MYKEALIKHLSKKHRRPQKHYQEALTEILGGITEQIQQGKTVHLLGFGTFRTRTRKSGKARNFQTKEPITLPDIRFVVFRPGKLLKHAAQKQAQPQQKKGAKKGLFNRLMG